GAPGADAVLVRRGLIEAVGRAGDLARRAPEARRLDARGGLILPGFSDAHLHLLDGGLSLDELELSAAKTEAEAAGMVGRWAAAHPGRGALRGRGWAYSIVASSGYPSKEALDAVVPDRPVVLESFDGHAYWFNSAALRRAGTESAGTVLEADADLVDKASGGRSPAEKRRGVERGLAHLAGLGVTSVAVMSADPYEFEVLAALERAGRLPIRVFYCPSLEGDLAASERLRARAKGPMLRFGWLKGFVDGVVESRTAAMLAPYAGSDQRGTPAIEGARLAELVTAAQQRGFSVALHAVGDAAVRSALDAFAQADGAAPRPALRRKVEHIEVVDPADLARFKALDALASMQPLHADPGGADPDSGVWARNLDPVRRRSSFAWRDLLDAGAVLAFGSDWPVASADPLAGMAAAQTRRGRDGLPEGGWNAHQTIIADEAVWAYTRGFAYAAGLRDKLGCLAPGCLPDLVVLEPGVRLDNPESLWNGRVSAVVAAGRVLKAP
ncbi:MAG: amidohydrolase, partial [Elusimicrobia bacterium]|nr:amidohydrolase [Elusimicrobiota bacterium]